MRNDPYGTSWIALLTDRAVRTRLADPAEERWMATRAGAHAIEFSDARHAGGITHYATQFTTIIDRAARVTAH